MHATDLRRRHFLKLLGSQAAMGGLGLGAWSAMGEVAAQGATDRKFLVCLYLRGGNDQSNTIVPLGGREYATYAAARPSIALAQGTLRPITPLNAGAPSLGLHPDLPFLTNAFNGLEAAIVANVGNLVQPTSLNDWNQGTPKVPVPGQLFSHNDQENQWHSASPRAALATGWLGRMADRLTESTNGLDNPLSMCMNVGRTNVMLTGDSTLPYRITPDGSAAMQALSGVAGSAAAGDAMKAMFQAARNDVLQAHIGGVMQRSIELQSKVGAALSTVSYATAFPDTDLGRQFKAVANMMSASNTLGHRRQVFFVDMDNFDFHDGLQARQSERFQKLDAALQAFQTYLKETGLWSSTVVFTASDFGRALQTNGKGADHGWGGHQFAMGGPVIGRRLYGQWPEVALDTAQDAGQGRLIPTTSIEQYGATLARWFGITADADLRAIFPNHGNFSHSNVNLDFLG